MTSLVSSPLVPSELDGEVDDADLPLDTFGLIYANSLRVLTTASLGPCEATFSFVCRSERHIGPQRRHLPHRAIEID